ncbi:LapA family protein [Paenibacillus wenxiniae]|uniref:Lipopolysaccharide assembly LapA domain-containing protein n=1 Tax=Paenibacillus wenxiniae TaxID=1636843 RepID=A0ABW4RJ98_9BACL
MRFQWTLILGLIFAVIIAIFAVINVNPVQVNLLFDVVQLPLILLILGCTLAGGLIVGFYGIYRQYFLQRKIKQLEAQVTQLGAAPVADSGPVGNVEFDKMYARTDDTASSFSDRKL